MCFFQKLTWIVRTIQNNKSIPFFLGNVPRNFIIFRNISTLTEDNSDNIKLENKTVAIYNYVSSPESPIKYGNSFISIFARNVIFLHLPDDVRIYCNKNIENYASMMQLWCFLGVCTTTNKTLYNVLALFLHYLPGYVLDFVAKCLGKKPM